MGQKFIDPAAFIQKGIRVITAPPAFFSEMPKTGGFLDPLVFIAFFGAVGGVIQALFMITGLQPRAGIAQALSAIIIYPVMIAIFSFLGAGIMFVIWKLLGSQENYETAYRCCAYVSAISPVTTLLGAVPYLGAPAGIALMTWYTVHASVEVHRIDRKKALLVFGIIGGLLALITLSGEIAARRAARYLNQMGTGRHEMQMKPEQIQKELEKLRKK